MVKFFAIILLINTLYAGKIVFPWRASNHIVKAGEPFEIWYNSESNEIINSVTLTGPYNQVDLSIDSITNNLIEYDPQSQRTYNNVIHVTVPIEAPIELYSIQINSSTGIEISNKSLQVLKTYKSRITIIQITDSHIGAGAQPLPGSSPNYLNDFVNNSVTEELPYFDQVLKVTEIISPEVVVYTGDNIQDNPPEDGITSGNVTLTEEEGLAIKWDNFFNGYKSRGLAGHYYLNSPSFLIPGNHDFARRKDAVINWNDYLGLRFFGFSYGDEIRFLAVDDYAASIASNNGFGVDDKPGTGVNDKQSDYFSSYISDNGAGKIRVLCQHSVNRVHNQFVIDNDIQLGLFGHSHRNYSTNLSGGGMGYTTGAASHAMWVGLDNVGWLRRIIIDDGIVVANDAVQIGDAINLTNYVTLNFNSPNDGQQIVNSATISNNLNFELENSRIRFVMESGIYTVAGGNIEQVIHNDSVSVYDVRLSVPANNDTSVTIQFQSVLNVSKNNWIIQPELSLSKNKNGISIRYKIPSQSKVFFQLLDLKGQLISSIATGLLKKGDHSFKWDLSENSVLLKKGLYVLNFDYQDSFGLNQRLSRAVTFY